MSNTNKKVYTLEIQGVKESYDVVVSINDALQVMDKTIQEVNKTQKQSKSTTDELTKAQEKLKQFDAEYQKELEKTKQALKEKNKAVQEEIKAEQLVEGSYYAKQATLTKLGKDIKSYVATTDEEKAILESMVEQYNTLNSELKEFDGTMGNHQRHVGDYTQASKDLKDELGNIEAQLQTMLANGITPNDAGFQSLAQRAGEIKGAIQQAGKEIDSFAQGSNKIKSVVDVSASLVSVYGLAQSSMAAFGIESEEVNESMQKMMAALTALNSLEEISNQLTDKSSGTYKIMNKVLTTLGLTKKADASATTAQATAQASATVATSAGTVAMKAFKVALASTGVGLLVVALGYLIGNFDEIKATVVEFLPFLGEMGDTFDNLKSVFMGVGEAIIQYITTPIRTIIAVVKGFMKDGIKGAIDAGKTEIKKGFDVVGNFEKGYDKQQKKNQQNRIKENAKTLDKQLNDKIKNLEAQHGSEYKFTKEGQKLYKQFYANKKLMYDKDSDEYKNAVNEELAYLRDVTKKDADELKKRNDAWKAAADKRKEDLKKLQEDTKKILEDTTKLYADNEQLRLDNARKGIEALKVNNEEELNYKISKIKELNDKQDTLNQDSYKRELDGIKEQYDKLIAEAERLNQDTTKLKEDYDNRKKQLDEKANIEAKQRQDDYNKYVKEENDKLSNQLIANSKSTVSEINKTLDNQLKNIKTMNTKATKTGGYFNVIDVKKTKEDLDKAKQAYEDLGISILEQGKIVATHYDDQLTQLEKLYGKESKQYQDLLNEKTVALDKYVSDYQVTVQASNEIQKSEADLMNNYWDGVSQQISEKFQQINDAVLTPLFDSFDSLMTMQIEKAQKELEKVQKMHDKAVQQVTDSQSRIESLNDQIKSANGLRRDELQKTLDEEMVMLKERESVEQQLAIETQKKEEEIAEKERQQKKMQAAQQILAAGVNTAVAITAALPNIPMAVLVGVMGAAQTAIAAANYAKMEQGGLLNGKRHSQGGMKIQGTNIEVEGGEYVVNRKSTAKYLPLLESINNEGRSNNITTNNFYKTFETGGQLDYELMSDLVSNNNPYMQMQDKLDSIDINPVVSVTEINKVNQKVTKVREMAGA